MDLSAKFTIPKLVKAKDITVVIIANGNNEISVKIVGEKFIIHPQISIAKAEKMIAHIHVKLYFVVYFIFIFTKIETVNKKAINSVNNIFKSDCNNSGDNTTFITKATTANEKAPNA